MNDNIKLVKNSIYNILYRCFSILFPLITTVYVARILEPTNIGRINAAQNIAQYFLIFSAMGIPTYGVKLIAQFKPKSKDSSKAFFELWVINFILSAISSILYYLLIVIVPFFYQDRVLYAVTGLSLVFNILNVDWFYQGIQEYKYIAIRSIAIKVISFISLFVFIHTKDDYLKYAIIIVLGTFGNYVFNIFRLRKYVYIQRYELQLKRHLSHIFILFGAAIAAEIYTLTDTTMLNVMCGSDIVAYYAMSLNIIRVLRGLVVAVSAAFLPQLSYSYYNGERNRFYILINKGLHILAFFTVPLAIGLIIVGDDLIIVFFGEAYIQGVLSTRILAFSIVSIALSNFIGLQVLVTIGKEKITTISTVLGALLNVIMNIILIPHMQHYGAAIASAATELFVTLFQFYFCSKLIKIKLKLLPIIISTIVMIPFVVFIHELSLNIYFRLFVETFVGVAIYGSSALFTKDEFALQIRQFVANRGKMQ